MTTDNVLKTEAAIMMEQQREFADVVIRVNHADGPDTPEP